MKMYTASSGGGTQAVAAMVAGRYRPLVSIFIILILACQSWSGAAYNNQQSKWLFKNLSDETSHRVTRSRSVGRHLKELTPTSGENGYRASLVDEDHKFHTRFGLSSMERIFHGAQKSRSRAWSLDSKARAAPYYKGTGAGRKLLQFVPPSFESTVEATPGSYSMAFSIGTPPQNFIAIADTGSDLVWLQCAACTVCFNQSSPLFQPADSSTYMDIGCSDACSALGGNELQCIPKCEYAYSYGDQSTTAGDYSMDTVTLPNFNGTTATLIPEFKFGCGLQNNGTFVDTDGIVGLARGPVSFPSQIAPYLYNVNKFSYCLEDKVMNPTGTSPIIFGGAAVPTNLTAVVYTPLLSPYNVSVVPYYYVNLQGISVGGTNLGIPASALQLDADGNGGTLFDSGTTYTQLTTEAYTAVLNEFMLQITSYNAVDLSQQVGLELCYDITGLTGMNIPTLVFHFENADFNLPFDNIMVTFNDAEFKYMCLALMGGSGLNIYGNTQQQNFQVVYEEDALQIGWVAADCTTL